MLIGGGLGLGAAQGLHVVLGLFQLPAHQGVHQLRLGAPLKLLTVGGGVYHIEQAHKGWQHLRRHIAAGVEKVGVYGRGV